MNPHPFLCAALLCLTSVFAGSAADVSAAGSADDRLAPLVEFIMQSGTNLPVGINTAKAFGLGEDKLPATQIALLPKDEKFTRIYAVSARNTNDIILAHIDLATRDGIAWLTGRDGKLRATITLSTNSLPKSVPNEKYADEFEHQVKFFLDLDAVTEFDESPRPLHEAAKFGNVRDVAKILKRRPTALNARDDEGMTPLAGAIVQEQVEVVRFLLERGANPNIPNRNGLSPLEHACGREKTVGTPMAELLLANGAEVNPPHTDGHTPLNWAVTADNAALVKILLAHGADAKASSRNGDTSLHTAADRGETEIAELLVAHGADINAKITGGTTPLHEAAWAGRDATLILLLSKGAEVDPKTAEGTTPLMQAVDREHKECVEILLAKGAALNAADDHGETPLAFAVSRGNTTIAGILLAHGADVQVKNKQGESLIQFAMKCRQPTMVDFLRQHGAKD